MAFEGARGNQQGRSTASGDGAVIEKAQTSGRDSNSTAMGEFPPASEDDEKEEDTEEEEDTEPNLRYTKLTGNLSTVYRNGDSTSIFIAAGDKIIIGTHNGNIHAFSLPSFQPLRVYQAHSASVTAISISPLQSFSRGLRSEETNKRTAARPTTPNTPSKAGSALKSPEQSPKTLRQTPVPLILSNHIFIGTASVDGHVCVASLVDPKDVTLRNYARPVQALALSPEFKSDRIYLSGGLAGELILTTGGRTGVSTNANTNSAAATASGWLESIGLASSTGKDTILHSGDGAIKVIKWSFSGKYVVWVDEMGVNVMRSSLHLEGSESEYAWKRINLVDRPRRRSWEDMAAVWQACAEWVDEESIEVTDGQNSSIDPSTGDHQSKSLQSSPTKRIGKNKMAQPEKLLVGWGDMIWVLQVSAKSRESTTAPKSSAGAVEYIHILNLKDCIISGLALYTPSLLLVLAYPTYDANSNPTSSSNDGTPRRGIKRRQNGQPPEVRLVELSSGDSVESDSLTVKNFESMTAADYHISTVFVPPLPNVTPIQKSTLGSIGGGLWDMGASATRMFNSGASILSSSSSGDKIPWSSPANTGQSVPAMGSFKDSPNPLAQPGLKIFLQSPFDCVLATKRDLSDRMAWLLERKEYREAWELANSHPEVVSPQNSDDSRPSSPSKTDQSMVEFFEDDVRSQGSSGMKAQHSAVEKEKRRIGELWLEQLIACGDWRSAGATASKVIGASEQWERWILQFIQAQKFDEITPNIPTKRLRPALPSSLYETILDHYLATNRVQFQEILDRWDPQMFNVSNIASAVESRLEDRDIKGDRSILLESLANLYLADARPRDALNCYIRGQNADAALDMVREYQLLDSVSEDIYSFILLRVPQLKLAASSLRELDSLSAEPIQILIEGTRQGLIRASDVVEQVKRKEPTSFPFLFFYFRGLWSNEGAAASIRPSIPRYRGKPAASDDIASSPLRVALDDFADLAITLFAEYSRPLLLPFLKSSTYSFEHASHTCESRGYIPELVYLLSVTGQAKRALHLIIESLDDVHQAIAFAKECDDKELWDDLLDYSMDKPAFIRVLLEEVGTSEGVDAVQLVRRIPEGLRVDGLKQGLVRIVRDFECQWSICEGAARVLRSEVAEALDILVTSRRRGTFFNLKDDPNSGETNSDNLVKTPGNGLSISSDHRQTKPQHGHCSICTEAYNNIEDEFLLGFPCGHVFHLSCFLDDIISADPTRKVRIERLRKQLMADIQQREDGVASYRFSVAKKVAHAEMINDVLGDRLCSKCNQSVHNSVSFDR